MTSAPAAMASMVCCSGGTQVGATVSRGSIDPDRDRGLALVLASDGQVSRLVLEPASADDIEFRVFPHRTLRQPGERRAFELRQVLAREEGDEVRRGIDGLAVDTVHQARGPPRRSGRD